MRVSAIIRIVIYTVIAIVCVALLIAGFTGMLRGINLNRLRPNSIRFTSGFDDSKYTISSKGEVKPKDIEKINIDWISGGVMVEAYDGDTIKFFEESSFVIEPDYQMRYLIQDGVLRIRFAKGDIFNFSFFNNFNKTLTVKIPKSMILTALSLDVTSASVDVYGVDALTHRINTVSGRITAENINSDSFRADSTSGRIDLEKITAKDVKIDSVSGSVKFNGECDYVSASSTSGSIKMDKVVSNETSINTISGSIHFTGVCKKIDTDSTSGSVTIECEEMLESAKINTISGSATIYLPENDGFEVRHNSISGGFNCEFDTRQSGSAATYKDGGASIRIDTVSGRMSIKKR